MVSIVSSFDVRDGTKDLEQMYCRCRCRFPRSLTAGWVAAVQVSGDFIPARRICRHWLVEKLVVVWGVSA